MTVYSKYKIFFRNDFARGLIFCMAVLLMSDAVAESQWELGVGLTALDIPFYPGSSQSETYVFPIPHFIYRSENLKIDNGLDATLLRTEKTRFNISADFAVPVSSDDSSARAGMPDLDLVIQVGPSLEVTLAGGRFKSSHFRLNLPIRAAIATNFSSVDNIGWVFEPRLSYETRRPYKTGFANLVSAGLRYSTEDLHEYYYNVDSQFATAIRPQYDAQAGYSGLFVDYIANWRTTDLIFFAVVRYQNLSGVVFKDSPLIEQNDYFLVGVGVTWVFAKNL